MGVCHERETPLSGSRLRVNGVYVIPNNTACVEQMAKPLLREVVLTCLLVSQAQVRSLYGLCVSLTLALPWSRYYTGSLHWDLNRAVRTSKCRLTHQYLRDFGFWKRLSTSRKMEQGRSVRQSAPEASLLTIAAAFGCGATINFHDRGVGVAGMCGDQMV